MEKEFKTFKTFYPYYLSEHQHPVCRRLHIVGSLLTLLILFVTLWLASYWLFILLPITGYGFAWVGHFVFEKNRPATFRYPFYSFLADWVMLKDYLLRKL